MVTMSEFAHGQFCWIDLMARDMQAAKKFYGKLFDWEPVEQDTQEGPPYICFAIDGQLVAGMGEMNDEMKSSGMPPVWNSYVNVDDVKAATDKAAGLGAKVAMPPMQVVQAGHMSILQDPSGAYISLWQKIDHCGAQLVNDPGSWVWNELITPQPEQSNKFYEDLFGWRFEKEQGSPGNYWMIKNGERMNGGVMERLPEMSSIPPHWSVYFAVAEINAATIKVKELGGSVMKEPFPVSVGEISVVSDAQGAAFQLIQMTVPVDQ